MLRILILRIAAQSRITKGRDNDDKKHNRERTTPQQDDKHIQQDQRQVNQIRKANQQWQQERTSPANYYRRAEDEQQSQQERTSLANRHRRAEDE